MICPKSYSQLALGLELVTVNSPVLEAASPGPERGHGSPTTLRLRETVFLLGVPGLRISWLLFALAKYCRDSKGTGS